MLIKLTYHHAEAVFRQSPSSTGIWGQDHFFVDEQPRDYDAWFVYEDVPYPHTFTCDPGRLVFVAGEPAGVRNYDGRFLSQFAAVVTAQSGLDHPNVIHSHPAVPWWVGVPVSTHAGKVSGEYSLTYDALSSMAPLDKPKRASVICSNKVLTEGHRGRLEFLATLQRRLGDSIDFFGHGFRPVIDKWDAIAPYRYHIVLENARAPHYWTEKLADAFLGYAFPIYCGAPNVSDYFAKPSICEIDRGQAAAAIDRIAFILREDPYPSTVAAVANSRRLVLDQYNLFPAWSRLARKLSSGGKRRCTVRPHRDFVDGLGTRLRRGTKRVIFGVGARSG